MIEASSLKYEVLIICKNTPVSNSLDLSHIIHFHPVKSYSARTLGDIHLLQEIADLQCNPIKLIKLLFLNKATGESPKTVNKIPDILDGSIPVKVISHRQITRCSTRCALLRWEVHLGWELRLQRT